jgi:hypothetical protein
VYNRDPDQEVNAATALIEGFRRQVSSLLHIFSIYPNATTQLRLGMPITPDIGAVVSLLFEQRSPTNPD